MPVLIFLVKDGLAVSDRRPQSIQFRVSSAELEGPGAQGGELAFQRNRPRPPAPQLVCPGLRPCRRGRAHRARVAVLESDAAPCSGALPAPRVPAEAAPSPWDFDGLGQATPRARRPPAVPSPAPAPVPAPRRQRSSCSQQLGGGGAGRPRCGRGQSQASGPPPPQPGADPRPAGGREQRGGEPSSPLVFQLPRREGQDPEPKPRGVSPTPTPPAPQYPGPRHRRCAPRQPTSAPGRSHCRPSPGPTRDTYLISAKEKKIYL
ncbi:unnamed protein product [Rangifer tarandus platyrhynchus]|uniref:Basic proline-rich protein-like n=1 Tax=Rangifer tarandus platyrhynchus TaxID=3082113 RepID=A0ABN8ZAE4_RANTA|nr:unnamed protein product [Rangifer tarandus platyrhynchus]